MNIINRNLLDYFLVFLIAIFMFWPLPPLEENQEKQDKLVSKSVPNDHFFLQRSFPDLQPDIKAYTQALKIAKQEMLSKSTSLPGFDYPWDLRGPGDAGGRVNAIAVHPTNENIILAGFSAGGIFKTVDGGANWYPVFDDQPYLAIGDLIFDPSNSNTVYAGTGDPNITSNPFIGEGIYRSTDLGETWTSIGLTEEGIVSRIVIDPTDSDIIYAGTMGLPFAKSTKRGLYKTTDGGANWSQVLFLSDSTGVADVLLNPNNPQVLYAAGWDRIRNNSQSIIYGNGARIYKSIDGGQNWTMLQGGLPIQPLSRIGLAMSGTNPDVVFALYTGANLRAYGLYKTTDAGTTWQSFALDSNTGFFTDPQGGFGWYFGQLRVDPNNDNRLYLLGVELWATTNGGLWWSVFSNGGDKPHLDHHDLTFTSSGDILAGTDGGLYKHSSLTSTWTDIDDIPTSQFYRIAYNPHNPDAFYGGTQDNGTQMGLRSDATDWDRIFGGDGFQIAFNPADPDIFYTETQNGFIWETTNGGISFSNISDNLGPGEPRAWDMQYIISPNDPNILYTGTDRLYVRTGQGNAPWIPITGVLAAPDGVTLPQYHLVSTLSESPVDSALVYVGTSDAKVQRKNPDGTVTDISAGLPVRFVTDVFASPDAADVVFVAHSGYKDGELIPHLHRSDDRGNNWIDISGDLPPLGINDLFIMPNYNNQVIFAGTDGGLYATLDGGNNWDRLGQGIPLVPVFDIAYNEVHNELNIGTHARSLFSFPLDTIGISSSPTQVNLVGTILKETGEGINGVDISGQTTTASDGSYSLSTFTGVNCEIIPQKNTSIKEGLSILDIILIQRHLLFVDTLDSPYKYIAADVNHSENINVLDMIYIQRALLFVDTIFPGNTSWRFVDAEYNFTNMLDPLSETFPESYDCSTSVGNVSGVDFIGIKVGDVDGTASPALQSSGTNRSLNGTFAMNYEDQTFKEGVSLDVTVKMDLKAPLLGVQLGFEFDPDVLELTGVKSGSLETAFPGDLVHHQYKEDQFALIWSAGSAIVEAGKQDFFTLQFKTKSKGTLSEVLHLNSEFMTEAVFENRGDLELYDIDLNPALSTNFTNISESQNSTIEVFPNPFFERTSIRINSPSATSGQQFLKVFQMDGKEVLSKAINLVAGENTISIDGNLLPGKGLYYLSLQGALKSAMIPLIYR